MNRRRFVRASLVALLARPPYATAQMRQRTSRIGWVGLAPPAAGDRNPSERLFLATLRDLGYAEGTNLVVEWRYGGDRVERYAEIASELVGLRVDVVVTVGMPAVLAVKRATGSIPIVMAVSEDPVGAGLAASLARPGGNVTGFTRDVGHEVTTKAVQLLREALPVTRVGVMIHESNGGIEQLVAGAAGLGITLRRFAVRTPDDITRVYETVSREPVDALYVLGSVLTNLHRQRIIELSAAHRIPTMYWWRQLVMEGGLMAYGIDFNESFRQAAHYVNRILRGASPATLPIQQPTKFELVISVKTAKDLGLTIPPSLLARADEIIR